MSNRPTGAENVHWDLTHLYEDENALRQDLTALYDTAKRFSETWWGRISDLEASQLQKAIAEYEQLQERSGRAMTYAYLYWATATHDPERGALLQYVRETCTKSWEGAAVFWPGVGKGG